MNIKTAVKEAYNSLPKGSKKRAAQIHGVTTIYFKKIVNGDVVDSDVYYSALQAIKQASDEAKKEMDKSFNEIKNIVVNEYEEL